MIPFPSFRGPNADYAMASAQSAMVFIAHGTPAGSGTGTAHVTGDGLAVLVVKS